MKLASASAGNSRSSGASSVSDFGVIFQRLLTDVRYVARYFLGSQPGVACADLEFLDVDRGIDVFLKKPSSLRPPGFR
jgi:hypothetical protein